ncbi:MAG: ATP-binding protein, partial [Clostridiales bacterium]|nr:ATP-binding protein [Clostridiales bacterium]
MSIDGKILAKAKVRLEERKREFEIQRENRLREVYVKCPRIMALDREIKNTVIDVIGIALKKNQDPDDAIAELREKNLDLQSERVQALIAAGFSLDYIDDEYLCSHCRDTGYIGTEICSCLKKLYTEELKASLSNLFKLGNESFDNFDLSWYDDISNPELGMPTRSYMEGVCETCYRYANKFSLKSTNLFFNGGTGLGKTFLSACIARVVADSGFSVVYDMACSIFTAFEEDKFSKSDAPELLRGEIRRYIECDLLIIDD